MGAIAQALVEEGDVVENAVELILLLGLFLDQFLHIDVDSERFIIVPQVLVNCAEVFQISMVFWMVLSKNRQSQFATEILQVLAFCELADTQVCHS